MNNLETFEYQGHELDIFVHAKRWKQYWASRIERWICGDVLEVGAGLGHNTVLLQNERVRSWYCLDPDAQLVAALRENVARISACSVGNGTIPSVSDRRFDTILYIDVLEHIENDREELAAAARLLRSHGRLVVLAPAHNFLFSAFDAAIGHKRRYNKRSLRACSPQQCHLEGIFYLDGAGITLSLANRLLLRQSYPTLRQIKTWDTWFIPISRVVDPVLRYRVGKSIIAVWTRL